METLNVFDEIIKEHRMPVLFIGSGIPKRYLYNYPDWKKLLETSFYKVSNDSFLYQKYYDEFNRKGYSQFEINKALGTAVENEFNNAFFEHKIKIDNEDNPVWVSSGISPYKMYLSKKFKKMSIYSKCKSSEELQEFRKLKNKVSAIITTNYDQFLEKYIFPDDYTVFVHQSEMFSSQSYNIAEIYKIHGCISDADSIVITEKDYDDFDKNRKLFIAKMLTLFAESPIIFLGYSFTDENVQNIVYDFLSCLSKKDLENIYNHIIFITYEKGQMELVQERNIIITSTGNHIPITQIKTDNYKKVYEQLNRVTPGVSASRIRETKRIVKKIVDKSVEQGQENSVIVNIEDLDNISNTKALAIAIGYQEDLQRTLGYSYFPNSLIYKDILLNDQNLIPSKMCEHRFTSIKVNWLIPVYKYAKDAIKETINNNKLISFINNRDAEDKILTPSSIKSVKNRMSIEDYDSLITEINKCEKFCHKSSLILKNIKNFSANQIRDVCVYILEEFEKDECRDSNFKRCVMYLDFIENFNEYKERLNSYSLET